MAKKVRLLSANFRSWSGSFGAEAITTIPISAPFERLVADQLGIAKRVYSKREEDEPDMRGWVPEIDWLGPLIVIRPNQATTNGKVKLSDEWEFRALQLNEVKVNRHKDDEQMLISFNVKLLDADAKMH